MHRRTLGFLIITTLLFTCAAPAQTVPPQPQAPTATPGPAAPRPQSPGALPPRDNGAAQATTGTAKIRGRVVAAESGNPLRRAMVRLSGTQNAFSRTATTDADGRYEFSNLPPARYMLIVMRPGYVTLQHGQQRPFEPGKPLSVADGQVVEKVDFALPHGGVIVGKITDETGEPLPGVRVQAQRYQYMPGGQRRLIADYNQTGGPPATDDLGQFRVYGLMPGSYVLSATPQNNGMFTVAAPGVALGGANREGNEGYATTYYPGTSNLEEAQTITVNLGQEAPAYFSLVAARLATISGSVRTSQGSKPTGRLMVSLRTSTGGAGYTMSGGAMVGQDGNFSISNVAPGEHTIDVRSMTAGAGPGAGGAPGEEEFASIPITVSGQDITGLAITTGTGATILGRVVFDGTSPRPQASAQMRVSVNTADPYSSPMISMGPTQDNGVIDENGRFQLRGINGRVLFRMGMPPWLLKSVTLNGVEITDIPFDAKPGTTTTGLEILLTDRQTSISGTVRNSRGEAVKDFVAVFLPADAREGMAATRFTRTIRPDQEGNFQVRGLPPGDYVAIALESLEQGGEWDAAFQQFIKPRGKVFRLTEGQTATVDLPLLQ